MIEGNPVGNVVNFVLLHSEGYINLCKISSTPVGIKPTTTTKIETLKILI